MEETGENKVPLPQKNLAVVNRKRGAAQKSYCFDPAHKPAAAGKVEIPSSTVQGQWMHRRMTQRFRPTLQAVTGHMRGSKEREKQFKAGALQHCTGEE